MEKLKKTNTYPRCLRVLLRLRNQRRRFGKQWRSRLQLWHAFAGQNHSWGPGQYRARSGRVDDQTGTVNIVTVWSFVELRRLGQNRFIAVIRLFFDAVVSELELFGVGFLGRFDYVFGDWFHFYCFFFAGFCRLKMKNFN